MILLCSGCNEKKDYYRIKLNEPFHPYHVGNCKECGENVFEVDELMLLPIIELNKKGWTTLFCCSGHMEESVDQVYIKFKHMPDTLPFGFYKDGDCIRSDRFKSDYDGIKNLYAFDRWIRMNRYLLVWAINLPYNN